MIGHLVQAVHAVVHMTDRLDAEEVAAGRRIDHKMRECERSFNAEAQPIFGPDDLGFAVPTGKAMVEFDVGR